MKSIVGNPPSKDNQEVRVYWHGTAAGKTMTLLSISINDVRMLHCLCGLQVTSGANILDEQLSNLLFNSTRSSTRDSEEGSVQ